MPWPWVQLPQKIRHSVGLSRITDKLIPSIDWKKSFNRSSTQAWGSRDCLLWAVKIRTNRLYFSRGHTPSATGAGAGDTHRGSHNRAVNVVIFTGAARCSQEWRMGTHLSGFLLHCAGSTWHTQPTHSG